MHRASIIQNYAAGMANLAGLSSDINAFWQQLHPDTPDADGRTERFREFQVRRCAVCVHGGIPHFDNTCHRMFWSVPRCICSAVNIVAAGVWLPKQPSSSMQTLPLVSNWPVRIKYSADDLTPAAARGSIA